jgi:hypothetical protein
MLTRTPAVAFKTTIFRPTSSGRQHTTIIIRSNNHGPGIITTIIWPKNCVFLEPYGVRHTTQVRTTPCPKYTSAISNTNKKIL